MASTRAASATACHCAAIGTWCRLLKQRTRSKRARGERQRLAASGHQRHAGCGGAAPVRAGRRRGRGRPAAAPVAASQPSRRAGAAADLEHRPAGEPDGLADHVGVAAERQGHRSAGMGGWRASRPVLASCGTPADKEARRCRTASTTAAASGRPAGTRAHRAQLADRSAAADAHEQSRPRGRRGARGAGRLWRDRPGGARLGCFDAIVALPAARSATTRRCWSSRASRSACSAPTPTRRAC